MALDRRLYDRLGVPHSATPAELKRAYRRLALQYHPDKNGGHEAEFQEITRAYEVLSVPASRRIYDGYGELGVTVLGTVKSPAMVEFLLNTRRLRVLFCAVLVVLALAACFPFVLAWKVSGLLSSWSWLGVFSPLLLLDVTFGALGSLLMLLSWKAIDAQAGDDASIASAEEDPAVNRTAFIVAITAIIFIFGGLFCQELLIALRLDGTIQSSWWIVLLPYLIVEGIWALWSALSTLYILAKWDTNGTMFVPEEERRLPWAKTYFCFASVRWIVLRLWFVVALIGKSSHPASRSWLSVFAPWYLILPLSYLVDFRMDRYKIAHEVATCTLEQTVPPSAFVFFLKYIPYSVFVAVALVSVGLLHRHLAVGTPGWAVVFSPIYVIATVVLLAILIGGFICYRLMPDFEDIQRRMGTDNPTAVVIDRELDWLRRFGYILGPFQRHIAHTT